MSSFACLAIYETIIIAEWRLNVDSDFTFHYKTKGCYNCDYLLLQFNSAYVVVSIACILFILLFVKEHDLFVIKLKSRFDGNVVGYPWLRTPESLNHATQSLDPLHSYVTLFMFHFIM